MGICYKNIGVEIDIISCEADFRISLDGQKRYNSFEFLVYERHRDSVRRCLKESRSVYTNKCVGDWIVRS